MELGFPVVSVAIVIFVIYLLSSIKILAEYEGGVIFRLGRLMGTAKGPGVILVFAPIDRMVRISLRQEALEVPPQDIITRDNVTLKVNAVIFLRVIDPRRAVVLGPAMKPLLPRGRIPSPGCVARQRVWSAPNLSSPGAYT